jgi:electron transfer flavoprotein beta subunit
MKQIIDPEIPPHIFQIDPVEKEQIRGTQSLVISTFDEVALEVALQLKDDHDAKVTTLTISKGDELEAIHQGLAMGADDAILISDPAFKDADAFGKARILAAALRKLGDYDAVLCGRQAGDVELGLVGSFLAEELDLPIVPLVALAEPSDGKMRLRRPIEGGYEVLQAPMPFVATVTNAEGNVPRYPSIRGIRAAMRRDIPTWTAEELGLEPGEIAPTEAGIRMDTLFIPEQEVSCEIITGESGAEKARQLVQRLQEMRLV